MAKSTVVQSTIKIQLLLNTQEATYIRAMLQYPVGIHPKDEPEDHREIRGDIYTALTNSLEVKI